jgi:hypothetical protein
MPSITTEQYKALMLGILPLVKSDIIVPNAQSSKVITRYITSEGASDEAWLGNLRDDDGKVDIFLLTFNLIVGKREEDRREDPPGTFTKPLSVVIDYFYDYQQGTDDEYSEKVFLENLFAVDLALEKKRGCLTPNLWITGWNFRTRIKRFTNASTHWAQGVLDLRMSDIFV